MRSWSMNKISKQLEIITKNCKQPADEAEKLGGNKC